ncbi:MAG: hypothetical protein AAF333_13295 [Planctomycetota bacterium]
MARWQASIPTGRRCLCCGLPVRQRWANVGPVEAAKFLVSQRCAVRLVSRWRAWLTEGWL